MKIPIKDLKQQKFVLDVEPSTLVSALKQKLFEERGWDPQLQKLIYSGKVMKDEDTVESYNIEEKGFVVCVISKATAPKEPKPAAATEAPKAPAPPSQRVADSPFSPLGPAPTTPVPAAAPAATPAAVPAPVPAPTTPQPAAQSETPAGGPSFNDPNALTVGAQRAEAIANMEAMGFERAQIDLAMRAAFYNPDRAVDYLLNGIPENLQRQEEPARQAPTAQPAAAAAAGGVGDAPAAAGEEGEGVNLFDLAAQQGRGGSGRGGGPSAAAAAAAAAAAGGPAGLGNLDFLRHNAQFQQLRQVVQQQPQMLEPILQQLGAGNPQLAQLISANPDQFLNLLSEAADDDVPPPPGAQTIAVTEEERDAIERLCRLGFDRDQAVQAYFACDKNEELAANFLFDADEEDDNQGGQT